MNEVFGRDKYLYQLGLVYAIQQVEVSRRLRLLGFQDRKNYSWACVRHQAHSEKSIPKRGFPLGVLI